VPSFNSGNWVVYTAKVPLLSDFLGPFDKEMEHVLDLIEKSFQSSVSTWAHKPVFERELEHKGGGNSYDIIGTVSTEDEVYGYLNNGTSVRWATMTKGFQAKTKVGRIKAGTGSGGLAYVSKKVKRPGIKARKWDELIANGKKRNVELALNRAVAQAIKASGHSI